MAHQIKGKASGMVTAEKHWVLVQIKKWLIMFPSVKTFKRFIALENHCAICGLQGVENTASPAREPSR